LKLTSAEKVSVEVIAVFTAWSIALVSATHGAISAAFGTLYHMQHVVTARSFTFGIYFTTAIRTIARKVMT